MRAARSSASAPVSALWLSRSTRLADLLAGVCVANPARLTFFKAGAGAGVGAAVAAFGSAATVAAFLVFGVFIGFRFWFLVLAAHYADCVVSRQNGV